MKKISEQIKIVLEEAFESCGYDKKYGGVTISNRPDLCQYQCNGAMAAAKEYKKAPKVIADEVIAGIKHKDIFQDISAVMPGFINITLKTDYIAEYFNKMAKHDKLGVTDVKEKKMIVIDYGGANVAKPLHVGHLRPAIIGESVKRIKRHVGNTVIGDVHLGDFGMPMGLVIEQLRDDMPDLVYFDESYSGEYPKEPPFTVDELEKIYPYASSRSKEDEEFKKRAQEATFRLQNNEPATYALWQHILSVSVKDIKKNYDNLKAEFDLWKGESDAEPYMNQLIEEFIDKGYAHESQGAIVIDICEDTDTKEMPPCLIRKSDGAATYATSDLATIYEREKLYQPKEYIYVADKRQEMHFTQIFRASKKTSLVKDDTNLVFLGFGTMCGSDGKPFKTRDGGVARLDSLIQSVEDKVYEKITANRTMEEEEARAIAKVVGLSALKYGDLSNQLSKDYVFDVDRFTSFEGNTGPYILYTMVRIKSILEKYQELKGTTDDVKLLSNTDDVYSESETELLLHIARYNEMIENASDEYAPHKICQYIYELSNLFNKFYHENKIITEEDEHKQRKWIIMITMVLEILNICIYLLGFEAPDKM